MPVNIPQIQKLDVAPQMPKNDRINLQVRDNASMILSNTNKIAAVGDEVGQIYQQHEDTKIEQLSNGADQQYAAWVKQKLNEAKNYQGDPTKYYKDLDEQAAKKREEIASSFGDVSERVSRHVNSRFNTAVGTRQLEIDYQRGAQQETYDNNQYEASVKFKKDDLSKTAGYVQKDDPSSFMMFESGLKDIKDTIIKRGMKKGSVTVLPDDHQGPSYAFKDDDGKIVKVQVDDVAKSRIAKELSEGVRSSIETLIAGGRTDEAEAMKNKYKDYLDTKGTIAIDKQFKTSTLKKEAYNIAGGLRGLDEESQMKKIDEIKDPELHSEALKIVDADNRRISAMKTRKAKANYDRLFDTVDQRMRSDNPYNGIAEFEAEPGNMRLYENMTPTQKKAVHEMIEAPKESNTKSLALAYQHLDDDEYMQSHDLNDFIADHPGLKRGDLNKVINQFTKAQNPSDAQERQTRKEGYKLLRDNLLMNHVIKKDAFSNNIKDKQMKEVKYREHLDDWYATFKTPPSYDQVRAKVKEMSAKELGDAYFNRQDDVTTGQSGTKKATVGKVPLEQLKGPELYALKTEYRKVNKGRYPAPNDPGFVAWYNKR